MYSYLGLFSIKNTFLFLFFSCNNQYTKLSKYNLFWGEREISIIVQMNFMKKMSCVFWAVGKNS